MDEKELLDRLDFIEFRQELLFKNDPYSRELFDNDITREQDKRIGDLFDDYRDRIDKGERVSKSSFEQIIYEIVPHKKYEYHFAESIALANHESDNYEEVFEQLYGKEAKYQSYLNKNKN
ncbi:DUF1878 domain-containing protein [Lysinibacillus sphaericus]|uniref:hypothetical protein n=1 Tax=Lysinibacillus sphaericus TaxID=1421 RepID=UPI00055FC740|nr:hypothetical protein [Lysinibacillus sphaericus]QTB21590.1 DUF1878 domain-containing protein [Lysinibacillus sphaericus]